MMTSSNGNIFRVTGPLCGEVTGPGEFPTQRPVTRSFDVFFDLRLNKRLSKQPWGWWLETPSWSLWRQCNDKKTLHTYWLDTTSWWRRDIGTLSALLTLCERRVTGGFPQIIIMWLWCFIWRSPEQSVEQTVEVSWRSYDATVICTRKWITWDSHNKQNQSKPVAKTNNIEIITNQIFIQTINFILKSNNSSHIIYLRHHEVR